MACEPSRLQRGRTHTNMMNLLDIYTALARERPNEPALIFEREPYVGIRLSWAQLAARGEELSLRLAAAGISRQSLCAVELADRKSTRLNSSHVSISYAVFCLKKKIT